MLSPILIDILQKNCVFSLFVLGEMPLLDQRGDVRDWALPGWHWEVLPSGTRSLVRNPGDVVEIGRASCRERVCQYV